ncbi:hypothetical protein PRIPAC_80467 [Pristionchus pacificus]|uniref:Zinc finger protein n=1 Tax=Pristionchus pacificus TaxID=54126 RepID=A0A2A6BIC1_PRIPA|nr:hypothetical protein PRIPAC_80467 [Pristionchus pacificus]|eukprot:PDM65541.1 zinc finger protein [Pristionchus pacificus]
MSQHSNDPAAALIERLRIDNNNNNNVSAPEAQRDRNGFKSTDNEHNESLGADAARFSRSCCHREPRGPRLIATACGHAICRACAAKAEEERCPDGSRACPVCLCDAPVERCALRRCGHILCEACYHEIRKEATEQGAHILCPLCRSGIRALARKRGR